MYIPADYTFIKNDKRSKSIQRILRQKFVSEFHFKTFLLTIPTDVIGKFDQHIQSKFQIIDRNHIIKCESMYSRYFTYRTGDFFDYS